MNITSTLAVEASKKIDELIGEKNRLRKVLTRLCDEIAATEEHGDGAQEEGCPICDAYVEAREILKHA